MFAFEFIWNISSHSMPSHFLALSSWLLIFMTMHCSSVSLVSLGLSSRITSQFLRQRLHFTQLDHWCSQWSYPNHQPLLKTPQPIFRNMAPANIAAKAFIGTSQLFAKEVREYLQIFLFCFGICVCIWMWNECRQIIITLRDWNHENSGGVRLSAAVHPFLLWEEDLLASLDVATWEQQRHRSWQGFFPSYRLGRRQE